ncbi:Hypothetical protein GbCGDNIH6_1011 [Granulibacter bethesdensis]|uniref:DUF177 domain-containing protein n=1 Tax=Granulibacter bethesdensis TaxID=364410 RepID=UPI00090C2212|nr:DUF177 domain-containing protein [Granulibacter bethesdensis]APH56831.1 Hypothetical protein GbCGDNIH6_1011 [Granulibacter bethesdensis]
MQPEFSRLIQPDIIPVGGRTVDIKARAEECAAIASRLGLEAVATFSCVFVLEPQRGGVIRAHGRMEAAVTQTCVVSLEPFRAKIKESFTLRLTPEHKLNPDFDIEEEEDEVPYTGDQIDLGEVAVEQLALTLDPYPRKPGVTFESGEDEAAEDESAEQADSARENPFLRLAALKKPVNDL